jgi:DNA-binding MarR family transcriptional regulator
LGHVEPNSYSHQFLHEVESDPTRTNTAIAIELEIDDTAVSRVGRRLVEAGLVRKRRLGRTNQWLITHS